jgi:hypothetical protein
MKRTLIVFLAVALALSLGGFAVAADHAAGSAKTERSGKAAAKKIDTKPKARQFTGTIESVDAAAGTLTVLRKKGKVKLKAGEKVRLQELMAGERVIVKHADGTALHVRVLKRKKTETRTPPRAEKAPEPKK